MGVGETLGGDQDAYGPRDGDGLMEVCATPNSLGYKH